MIEKLNPILAFRKLQEARTEKSFNSYDLITGGRVDARKVLLAKLPQFNNLVLSTLITETREAVDSSESS